MEPNTSNQNTEPTNKSDLNSETESEKIAVSTTPASSSQELNTPEKNHSESSLPPSASQQESKTMLMVAIAILIILVIIAVILVVKGNNSSVNTTSVSSNSVVLSPAEVSINSSGFVPATITVKVGQAVIWTNNDSAPHQVASDPYPTNDALAGFNDKSTISQNDTFNFVFNKAGIYTYHDNLNPFKFKGTVIVK